MFEKLTYLIALLATISCLTLIDFRWKLVISKNSKAGLLTILYGLIFFIIWDLCGIHLGIFYPGNSRYVTHIMLLPKLPLEEVFFLTVLCYTALLFSELIARFKHE